MMFKLPTFYYEMITIKQLLYLSIMFIKYSLSFSDEISEVITYIVKTQGSPFGKLIPGTWSSMDWSYLFKDPLFTYQKFTT